MHRELATAYIASLARLASWAVVTALVYRFDGARALAAVAFARATVGFLSYAGLGLGPALVTVLPRFQARKYLVAAVPFAATAPSELDVTALSAETSSSSVLAYAVPQRWREELTVIDSRESLLWGTRRLALALFCVVSFAAFVLASVMNDFDSDTKFSPSTLVVFFGLGLAFRLWGDVPAAALQTGGRIVTDNVIAAAGEVGWVGIFLWLTWGSKLINAAPSRAALAFTISSAAACLLRFIVATDCFGPRVVHKGRIVSRAARVVLPAGLLITLLASADFLYAPANLILLELFTDRYVIAGYAPVLQIDAALLVLVGGLSAVLLPKSALAHGQGDLATLRAYYVRGTLVSFMLLAVAAVVVVLTSKWLLTMWLGYPIALSVQLMPFVMIHTVIGGASGVGRSVLLGMGKAKPLAVSALIAGVCNVALAWLLVGPMGWGVWGVVYATILTVTLRCGVWMPWYVMRKIKESLDIGA